MSDWGKRLSMLNLRISSSKSAVDFLYMFLANIIKKGFGFFREIILAFLFGSSIIYANFLLLKTAADLFSQFTQGSSLQANLLSKFSNIYKHGKEVSLQNVMHFLKQVSYKIFLLSQIIQIPLLFYISPENIWLFVLISIVLGILISANFFSSIFWIVMQGKGEFKKFSISTTLDIFISTILLYPLSFMFGVVGIVFSRIAGVSVLIYKYFTPMFREVNGEKINFSINDINFSVLLLGNFAHIIIFLSRFAAGLDGNNNITFFNYSVVLLNVFLTAIIMNLNTIVLRNLSLKKEGRIILLSFLVSLVLGLSLVFIINLYGFYIIQFIFQRGAFTVDDTYKTFLYAKDLSFSFVLIFVSSALFQPFFSLDQKKIRKDSKSMASIFIIVTLLVFLLFNFMPTDSRGNSLILIYSLSTISVLMALFSLIRYFKLTKSN